ncbi:hypothetical protein ACLF6K_06185 [Streptomyces xanthophaeus]
MNRHRREPQGPGGTKDLPYDTSEKAAAATGVFLAANTTTTDGDTT